MDRIGLICRYIKEDPRSTQRDLAQKTGFSVGTVNTLIKEAMQQQLIAQGKSVAGTYELTGAGDAFLEPFQVDGALIIAAGFGSRFVPLTFETPKGLLEVFGERMIERQIKQLHEAGITDITIAVGYLKEKFEYLIDKYQVKLLYNPEYATKNTLTTIYRARQVLAGKNMYILSSDNWLRNNMFHAYESGAWYAYEGSKIGQGRENAKNFLAANPEICLEIENKVRVKYGLSEDTMMPEASKEAPTELPPVGVDAEDEK